MTKTSHRLGLRFKMLGPTIYERKDHFTGALLEDVYQNTFDWPGKINFNPNKRGRRLYAVVKANQLISVTN